MFIGGLKSRWDFSEHSPSQKILNISKCAWQLGRLRRYFRTERKIPLSHVLVFADSWIKVTHPFFSAPLTFAAPYSLSDPQKKMPRRVLGAVTSRWSVAVLIQTAFSFSLQVAPMWHKQWLRVSLARNQQIELVAYPKTGPAEALSMLSGAQACSPFRLFEWEVIHRRRSFVWGNSQPENDFMCCCRIMTAKAWRQ